MIKDQIVYAVVSLIPQGKVSTYGDIASYVGLTNPRTVGAILHRNSQPETVPCHRVVNSVGRLAPSYAFGGEDVQRTKLIQDGVVFKGRKVDLRQSLWQPTTKDFQTIQLSF